MNNINFFNTRKTIASYMLADGMEPVIDLDKSHGSWLVDGRDGREYLDLFSMFASMSVGYNHPYVIDNKERLLSAVINKPTNSDVYSIQMAEFVDSVGRIAQPDYLPHSFYIEGGGLAVENALKTAFDWKVRKNIEKGKGEKGGKVIHLEECFHGRTGYTLSLTDSPDKRKTNYFPKFDWPRITNPKLKFPISDSVLTQVKIEEDIAINEIKQAILSNNGQIAAIIIEPIQGEGGDNHFRDEFFIALRNICDEDEIIFIMDEIQTGICITGKMWAHEYNSVKPDIISFGKKTQVCGMLAGERILEVDNNVFTESSRINSTFGGNLVDMVRFQQILKIIEEEQLIENANIMGSYLLNKLETLMTEFPGFVTNVRGKGLFCAFDLPSGTERDNLINEIMKNNLLMLGSGDESIRFRPHLNVSREDLDCALEIITKSIGKCLK